MVWRNQLYSREGLNLLINLKNTHYIFLNILSLKTQCIFWFITLHFVLFFTFTQNPIYNRIFMESYELTLSQ